MSAIATIPKLPNRPLKPYIQPDKRENKAMTVVVGFSTGDAVVLCADQQVTSPGSFKYYDCKIHTEKVGNAPIVFAYSGLPSLEKEAREKIIKKLMQTEVSEDSVHQAADEVLTEMG